MPLLCLRWGLPCCGGSCIGCSGSGCFCRCGDLFHCCPCFRFFFLFFSWGCIFFCSFAPPWSLSFLAATFHPALGLVMASLVAIVTFDLVLVSVPVLAIAIAGVRGQASSHASAWLFLTWQHSDSLIINCLNISAVRTLLPRHALALMDETAPSYEAGSEVRSVSV